MLACTVAALAADPPGCELDVLYDTAHYIA